VALSKRFVAGPANSLRAVAAGHHTNDLRCLWRRKRIERASDPLLAVYPKRAMFRQDFRRIRLFLMRVIRQDFARCLLRLGVVPDRDRV
jgi:hypothetical protein